ncbi:MAG TPA: tetratricopeptide repeat protein, partial [Chromatiales bacterium]|nr:tetratricopeptide repeat protein [Chromatiales bacterium]
MCSSTVSFVCQKMCRLKPQRHSPGFVDKTLEKTPKTAGLGKLLRSMRTTAIYSAALLGLLLLAAIPASLGREAPEDAVSDIEDTPTADTAIDSTESAKNAGSIAYERMLEFMAQGYYDLAAQAARQVLDQTREKYGDQSIEQVAALNNLARAQMLNGDLVDAETTYKQSIDLTERLEGILSPRLINAYVGLGATYNRAGLHNQSVEAFKRALRLNHVNEGFYNLEQFIILDGMTEAYLGLKEYENAHFYQSAQLEIAQRKFGAKDPRT